MFWKKKKNKEQEKPKLEAHIQTMPAIFYGGNDPEIYHHRTVDEPPQSTAKKNIQVQHKKRRLSLTDKAGSADPKKKKLILVGVGAFLFLSATGAASWYYLSDYFSSSPEQTPVQNTTIQEQENTGNPVQIPTSTEQNETPTTTPAATSTAALPPSLVSDGPLQFSPIILANAPDADNDQLTNREEELFNTDSGGFDSDADGYFDGQEVFNLYNPSGIAPRRLIDSGLVREYVNPLTQYRIYYPFSWQAGLVDTLGKHVLFSNVVGDYVEVRTFDRVSGQTFTDWFAQNATDQKITDLLTFKNRFDVDGWKRRDDLVAYFMDQNRVYVLIFHPAQVGPVAYRNVTKMMIQSFRYASSSSTLPDQVVIPGTEGFVTSTQPVSPETSTSTEADASDDSATTTDQALSDNSAVDG